MSIKGEELFVVEVRLQWYKLWINCTSLRTLSFPHTQVGFILNLLQLYSNVTMVTLVLSPTEGQVHKKKGAARVWQCGINRFTSTSLSQVDQQQIKEDAHESPTACLLRLN